MNNTYTEQQYKNLLQLIKYSISSDNAEPIKLESPDWNQLFLLAKRHNIMELTYYAVEKMIKNQVICTSTEEKDVSADYCIDTDLLNRWKEEKKKITMQFAYQDFALEEVKTVFEEEKIPVVLLKGSVLRDLYPLPDMRSMADIDVLIHEEDGKRAGNILKHLGYEVFVVDSRNEDVYTKEDMVTIEVHRQLFWKADKWNEFFESSWERMESIPGYQYCHLMSPADFYIHLLGHIIHHMENGGIGVRAFIDLWVYTKKYTNQLEDEKLVAVLEELGLLKFSRSINKLLKIWFENKSMEPLYQEWTEFIMNSGVYGSSDNFILRNPAMGQGTGKLNLWKKLRYCWKRLVPDYEEFCKMFPKATESRRSYLYYTWKRWVNNGMKRIPAVKNEIKSIQKASPDAIGRIERLYDSLGIPQISEYGNLKNKPKRQI